MYVVGNADIERISQAITNNNVPDKWARNYNYKEKYIPKAKPGNFIFTINLLFISA